MLQNNACGKQGKKTETKNTRSVKTLGGTAKHNNNQPTYTNNQRKEEEN